MQQAHRRTQTQALTGRPSARAAPPAPPLPPPAPHGAAPCQKNGPRSRSGCRPPPALRTARYLWRECRLSTLPRAQLPAARCLHQLARWQRRPAPARPPGRSPGRPAGVGASRRAAATHVQRLSVCAALAVSRGRDGDEGAFQSRGRRKTWPGEGGASGDAARRWRPLARKRRFADTPC